MRAASLPWQSLKWIIAAGLLAYIVYQANTNDLLSRIRDTDGWPYLASVLVALAGPIVNAWKYHRFLADAGTGRRLLEIAAINFESWFYSIALPSGLGQAVLRWYKLTAGAGGRLRLAVFTVYERAVMIVLVLAIGFAALASGGLMAAALGWTLAACSIGALVLAAAMARPGRGGAEGRQSIESASPAGILARLWWHVRSLREARYSTGLIAVVFVSSGLWLLLFLARFALLLAALHVDVQSWFAVLGGIVTALTMMVPISINGLGVREYSLGVLFAQMGLGVEAGVAVGLLFFSHSLAVAAVGAVLIVLRRG